MHNSYYDSGLFNGTHEQNIFWAIEQASINSLIATEVNYKPIIE